MEGDEEEEEEELMEEDREWRREEEEEEACFLTIFSINDSIRCNRSSMASMYPLGGPRFLAVSL